MKFTKVLAASVVSTAVAASMAVSASAATKDDAVNAAIQAGAPSENVQQLKNFLDANAAHYTAADYDDFVNTVTQVGQKYRGRAFNSLTEAEQNDIVSTLVSLGGRHSTAVTCTKLANGHYSVTAQWTGSTSSNGGTTSSAAGGAQTAGGKAVADTGSVMAEESTSGAVAFAGLALVLAAAGVVVVTRKNRA